MQFEPLASEYDFLASASDNQLLEYFLMRIFETEEVWGLKQRNNWFYRPLDKEKESLPSGQNIMPLWPYKMLAREAALDIWIDTRPEATSLEYFMEENIPELIAADIFLDVMPKGEQPGCMISPQRLASIIEGMIDAGEYRLEG